MNPDGGRSARFFRHAFQGKADVRKVSEMIDEGYFGPRISDDSWGAWDLVILPTKQTVWWYEKDKFEQRYTDIMAG